MEFGGEDFGEELSRESGEEGLLVRRPKESQEEALAAFHVVDDGGVKREDPQCSSFFPPETDQPHSL
jgi:hypothetical protein